MTARSVEAGNVGAGVDGALRLRNLIRAAGGMPPEARPSIAPEPVVLPAERPLALPVLSLPVRGDAPRFKGEEVAIAERYERSKEWHLKKGAMITQNASPGEIDRAFENTVRGLAAGQREYRKIS